VNRVRRVIKKKHKGALDRRMNFPSWQIKGRLLNR
jgi:hypothetical protein